MAKRHYPLISVIVPAWNEEKYLKTLLPRLTNQDYLNYEIIVIDNNSNDNTSQVAKSYGVKVYSEIRQGISYARSKGFEKARGEIIIRTDADTFPERGWVTNYYEEFQKYPGAVAISGSSEFYDGGSVLKFISRIFFLLTIYLTRVVMGHFPLNGPNFAVRKKVAEKVSPHTNDSIIHEDMDLACHLSVYGKVIFNPNLVVKTSSRRLFNEPLFMWRYTLKSIRTYFLHHPSHRLHKVS